MRKHFGGWVVVIVSGLVAGCGSDACQSYQSVEIRVVFQGFGEYVGKTFKVRSVQGAETERFETDRKVLQIAGDAFEVRLFAFCSEAPTLLDFYVDRDGSGGYSPPPVDHAWRKDAVVTENRTLIYEPDSQFVDIQFPD